MKFFHHPDFKSPPPESVELSPSEDVEIGDDCLLLLPNRALHLEYPEIRPYQFSLWPSLPKIGVSKCILGVDCRYDGGNKKEDISHILEGREVIGICPEEFGGLLTPREPASLQIMDGVVRVLTNTTKKDVTTEYELGAQKSLQILEGENVVAVVLKRRSPSCDCEHIWGITARLLKANGFCLVGSPE